MLDRSREGRDWPNEGHRSNHIPMGGSYTRRVFTEAHLEKMRQDIEKNEASESFARPEAVLQKADVVSGRFYRLLANKYGYLQTTAIEQSINRALDPEQTSKLAITAKEGRLFLEGITKSHESTDNAFKARYEKSVLTPFKDLPTHRKETLQEYKEYISCDLDDLFLIQTKPHGAEDYPYRNYMDPKTGTMIVPYNFKDRDGQTNISPPGDKPLDNSQMLWHQFDFLAKELGLTKPYKLTEIIEWDIINPNVLAIKPFVKENEPVEFPKGSEEYLSATSRKVCKVKFHLVHQHTDDFGDNDIARIKILGGDLPDRIELIKYSIEPLHK